MDAAGSLCIFLLGRFEVTRGERLLHASAWTRRKAAALLQRLAFERRLLKEQAIEFLWPEYDPITGANNLYRPLHALRQSLDMELGAGADRGNVRVSRWSPHAGGQRVGGCGGLRIVGLSQRSSRPDRGVAPVHRGLLAR